MLFALANVWSIARTTYLMPAFEVLGPLQISLARMLGDITRFLVLFTLVRYTHSHPSIIIDGYIANVFKFYERRISSERDVYVSTSLW